jgi:hypothetical protein
MIWSLPLIGLLFVLLSLGGLLADDTQIRFPPVEGKALTGDKFVVPGYLSKPSNLLLVAFQREQQQDIDTWIPELEKVEEAHADFAFYEFPVLPEMNSVARWFIYQGMRSGITSERARARTVTFHINKQEFKDRLGIESEEFIHAFLVDSTGVVVWRAEGVWSEAKHMQMMGLIARGDTKDQSH